MLKLIVALVLFAHGIGHVMGPLQVFRVATINPAWSGDSWLLGGSAGTSLAQAVGVVLWIAALVGFTAVAAVVMGWLPAAWFAPLAVGSAVVSLIGIALFPAAFPVFSTLGAAAIDVAVLVAVLLLHWAPSDLTT